VQHFSKLQVERTHLWRMTIFQLFSKPLLDMLKELFSISILRTDGAVWIFFRRRISRA